MNIIIIANFNRELDGETDGRFIYIAEMLSVRGHNVKLISSDFSHGKKMHRKKMESEWYKSEIVFCHEPGYNKNISIKRLYSHFVFGSNVFKYLKKQTSVDIVYCAIPSLTAALKASKWCKKNRVKFVIDIQDLWPEAFAMKLKNRFLQKTFVPLKYIANQIYKSADAIIAVSNTYVERALRVNTHCEKNVSVCLGHDGLNFELSKEKHLIKRNDNDIWLCYIGTLSYSYDIKCVIDALAHIKKDNNISNVVFHILGDGPLKNNFEDYAESKGIRFKFWGRKPYPEMVGFLCSCDIAVNPIVKGSAASIINKVGDYALAGLPVINTQECKEYRTLLESYKCGINCECGNSEDVAQALVTMVNSQSLRKEMAYNSLLLAKEKFDRKYTYKHIIDCIENL